MAKVTFTTFLEASEYSKQLAMALKTGSAVHREGNVWWVDDPRIAEGDTDKIARYKKALHLQHNLIESELDGVVTPTPSPDSPLLKQFGRNLTQEAANGLLGPFYGRNAELQQIILTLARKSKNNPILVGDPGVGKTALVEALAVKAARSRRGEFLHGKVIIELNMGSLVAGTKYRGEFEERLTEIVKEGQGRPDVIIFIDEIHTLVGSGESEGDTLDGANILKPALSRSNFSCIGSTTLAEYRYIERDKALERRFEKIVVEEPDTAETVLIARTVKRSLEKHHRVTYDDAITAAVELSIRFDCEHHLPDKALDLLDKAGSLVSCAERNSARIVTSMHISRILAEKTGLPVTMTTGTGGASFQQRLQILPERLKSTIIGQNTPIDSVSRRLRVSYSGLSKRSGPVAVLLCIGPSGVGKTGLAKSLARELMGGEQSLLRFDMSEYMEEHSVAKLIGSPPGYIGHNEAGQLTEKLRKHPHSVLLLDEVEKAHSRIMDIFLQLFGEGRITDATGMTVSAANTIVIMTSNIKAEEGARIGFGMQTNHIAGQDHGYLHKYFRNELINRVDDVIIFNRLERDSIRRILAPMLEEIRTNLRKIKKVDLSVSEQVVEFLIDAGYHPDYGVRELGRAVELHIQGGLSEMLMSGGMNGVSVVNITVNGDKVVFTAVSVPDGVCQGVLPSAGRIPSAM